MVLNSRILLKKSVEVCGKKDFSAADLHGKTQIEIYLSACGNAQAEKSLKSVSIRESLWQKIIPVPL
ncbi:hypothetical protein BMS3Abin07_02217 [bacterium BMS3Abin07]|nr:hypothetical protein BMS3Abin07_02217 [bacterium BMS3Abin07]